MVRLGQMDENGAKNDGYIFGFFRLYDRLASCGDWV
jgi:hypothetical protein